MGAKTIFIDDHGNMIDREEMFLQLTGVLGRANSQRPSSRTETSEGANAGDLAGLAQRCLKFSVRLWFIRRSNLTSLPGFANDEAVFSVNLNETLSTLQSLLPEDAPQLAQLPSASDDWYRKHKLTALEILHDWLEELNVELCGLILHNRAIRSVLVSDRGGEKWLQDCMDRAHSDRDFYRCILELEANSGLSSESLRTICKVAVNFAKQIAEFRVRLDQLASET